MKRILLLTLLLPALAIAQHKSCCAPSSTEKFQQLASNEKFASSHANPLPFVFTAEKGSMVTYKTPDGKSTKSFEIKPETKSNQWLIVFHEWWGLNDYIKQEAEKLSKALPQVNVIAVDLYDGFVAATAEEAKEKMSSLKDDRAKAIIQGTINYAGRDAKIASLGWCMGGGWSLQSAIMAGKQGIGCVMYYGMPESDINKLSQLNGDVLGIFAKRDEWINSDVVAKFEQNMKDAGKKLEVRSFDAVHAFANPSNPNHDAKATEEAYNLTMDFLKERLK